MNPGKHHPHPINGAIQAATVLVLDEGRQAIGQFPLKEALAKTRAQGQDLILIASGAISWPLKARDTRGPFMP